jgi:hypothetical protein
MRLVRRVYVCTCSQALSLACEHGPAVVLVSRLGSRPDVMVCTSTILGSIGSIASRSFTGAMIINFITLEALKKGGGRKLLIEHS